MSTVNSIHRFAAIEKKKVDALHY